MVLAAGRRVAPARRAACLAVRRVLAASAVRVASLGPAVGPARLRGGPGGTGGTGGMGGLLQGSTASAELVALLQADASSYRWVAATVGANNAAGYQLASEEAVMPIGGFNGSDPSPTLEQFQAYVAAGDVHYFIGGGGFGSNGGSNASSEIASWVAAQLHRPDRRRGDRVRPHQRHSGRGDDEQLSRTRSEGLDASV